MAIYCQEGETATVILPNGTSRIFTDTPISISCISELLSSEAPIRCWRFRGRRRTTNRLDELLICGRVPGVARQLAFGQLVEIPAMDGAAVRYSQYWFQLDTLTFEVSQDNLATPGYVLTGTCNCLPSLPLYKTIVVTGSSGNELFRGNFEDCNYSVSCSGCPPRTIDCSGCCLNCDETFNSISSLRAIINRMVRTSF